MSSISVMSENDNSTVLAEYTGLNRVATSFQSEDALEKELIKNLVEQYQDSLKPKAVDETESKPIISKAEKSKNTTKSNTEQSKIAKKQTERN